MSDVLETVVQASNRHNEHRDCAVRALAIAGDYEYDDVHYVFHLCGRLNRKVTPWHVTEKAVKMLRFRMVDVTGWFESRTVRTLELEMRYRPGRYLVRVSRHLLPVVDGKVHDWTKGRLHRIISIFKLEETDIDFHRRNEDG